MVRVRGRVRGRGRGRARVRVRARASARARGLDAAVEPQYPRDEQRPVHLALVRHDLQGVITT